MKPSLQINIDPRVEGVFSSYPPLARKRVLGLRNLIVEAAGELEDVNQLEETLKWGEPSYIAKKGSTIRIAWKAKTPEQYAIYFKCTSKLVTTFRQLYDDVFTFEGNRAIVFGMDDAVPKEELKHCIKAGLRYHKVKDEPMLGM